MANDEKAVDTTATESSASAASAAAARILQLECIIAAKDRELEVVRRECAGLPGPANSDATAAAADALLRAENARLVQHIADLERRLGGASGGASTTPMTSSTPNQDAIARALALSLELQRLLTAAAGGGGVGGPAAAAPGPAVAGAGPAATATSSLPRWLVDAGSYSATATTKKAENPSSADASTAAPASSAPQGRLIADANGTTSTGTIPAPPAPPPPQVIGLNVSGVPMDALAAALARSPVLARMFADLRDSGKHSSEPGGAADPARTPQSSHPGLPVDSNGRIFLPYPPDCFAAVLDLLHGLSWWPRDVGGATSWPSAAVAAAAVPAAAAAHVQSAPPPAVPPPPPPPLTWWRDRIPPSREPVLRQLLAELGLQPLVSQLAVGGGGLGLAGAPAAAAAPGGDRTHPASTGNLYARLAELGR